MMIQTKVGVPMDAAILSNYLSAMINNFFKMEKALKWAKLVKDVQNMTTAWLRNTSS